MPLYRDSAINIQMTIVNSGSAIDISGYDFRIELSQGRTCVSLAMGSGLSFETDGTDGILNIALTEAQMNQFCTGSVRLRMFDDSGDDPVIVGEGSETVEGRSFDA
jgi:hypothetical protein